MQNLDISPHEEVKALSFENKFKSNSDENSEYIALFYAQHAIQFSKVSEVETNNAFSKNCKILGT